jgi:transcription elongation factor Elf1
MPVPPSEQEALAKKVDAVFGICPRCDSDDLNASDYDGDKTLSCKVDCGNCGLQWVEVYRFAHAINFEET